MPLVSPGLVQLCKAFWADQQTYCDSDLLFLVDQVQLFFYIIAIEEL